MHVSISSHRTTRTSELWHTLLKRWIHPCTRSHIDMTTLLTEPGQGSAISAADIEDWPTDGRRRVVIENVSPEIDAGRFPIKRAIGESVVVEAAIFADGHDAISCQ